jgi:hypothetical protein
MNCEEVNMLRKSGFFNFDLHQIAKNMQIIVLVPIVLLATGCASKTVPLNKPISKHHEDVAAYSYVVIEQRSNIRETNISANDTEAHGTSREFDSAQLIEGILLKKGLVRVENTKDAKVEKTLIAKWGVSGKRDIQYVNFIGNVKISGYAQEVTISLVKMTTLTPVFTCSAEGYGATEIEDIREAIIRCLSEL